MVTATLKAPKKTKTAHQAHLTPKAHKAPLAKTAAKPAVKTAPAVLTISSKNYGAWSLRGWLLAKLAGLA